jgi:hypothetical protein
MTKLSNLTYYPSGKQLDEGKEWKKPKANRNNICDYSVWALLEFLLPKLLNYLAFQ